MKHRRTACVLPLLLATAIPSAEMHAHPDHEQPVDHAADGAHHTVAGQAGQPARPSRDRPRRERMEPVELPQPEVTVTIEDGYRVIRSNGLPSHSTGSFPNAGNPNAIRAQSHERRLPLVPRIAEEPIVARPEFGIALNGVIFDAGTGEFWTATNSRAFGGGSEWNYEALGGGVPLGLDSNHAHVQQSGKYHYHGVPTGLLEQLKEAKGDGVMIHVGWAYDGFPIYAGWGHDEPGDAASPMKVLTSSYQLKAGERPESPEGPGGPYDGTFGLDYEYVEGSGDLDECNGRFGVTPEFPHGTYYYVITPEFPSIPRLWKGEPDDSIGGARDQQRQNRPRRRGGPGPRGEGPGEGAPRR